MKIFEILNPDGAIVIDDTFKNIELLDHFSMSECRFRAKDGHPSHGTYYLPRSNPKATLVGISLNGLNNVARFGFSANIGGIEFYDSHSGIENYGIEPVKRDDIASKSHVYLFGFGDDRPSEHGTGLEICNADGKVVYSSAKRYLNVLGCGSEKSETVQMNGTTIAFTLGTDHVTKIYENHKVGAKGVKYDRYPRFTVNENSISVGMLEAQTVYIPDDDAPDWGWHLIFHCYYNFGWLIGNVVI